MAHTRQGLIQRRAIQSDVHIQEYGLKHKKHKKISCAFCASLWLIEI
jgi:hypothetical protein